MSEKYVFIDSIIITCVLRKEILFIYGIYSLLLPMHDFQVWSSGYGAHMTCVLASEPLRASI